MKTTLFSHPYLPSGERFTIAGIVSDDKSKGKDEKKETHLNIGIALCSGQENFNKEQGRNMAEGRAKSSNAIYTLNVTDRNYKEIARKFREIPKRIIKDYNNVHELKSAISFLWGEERKEREKTIEQQKKNDNYYHHYQNVIEV